MDHNLKIGDKSNNGQVTIIDEDRLCYLVKSESKGSLGIRTISKAMLNEFVDYIKNHPNASANEARVALSGKSALDKFEYGYASTYVLMAQMVVTGVFSEGNNLSIVRSKPKSRSRQIIFYGAPGTGKSNHIDEVTNDENRIRTTFHPDSDYSTFVGAYKPTMDWVVLRDLSGHTVKDENTGKNLVEKKIAYKFVPQAFLKAYVKAWKLVDEGKEDEPFYLVIEEINRGNCAQIFGDLFQLLDRDDEGGSQYGIVADDDIRQHLKKEFADHDNLPEEIKSGEELRLPKNLYIWATMNTSDQSLFPIDSAFKRRWDWEYMPIENAGKDFVIQIGTKRYDWWTFISTINDKIDRLTSSEDKKLGYWFARPTDGSKVISEEQFVGKVLFYLWNDVYKDYGDSTESIFRTGDGQDGKAPFTSFFGSGSTERLQAFMAHNKIEPIEDVAESDTEDDEVPSEIDAPQEIETNELRAWQQQYWTEVKERCQKLGINFGQPAKRYCFQVNIGAIGMTLIFLVKKSNGDCWAGIYIEAAQGEDYYPTLYSYKQEIEDKLGYAMEWEHEAGRHHASMRLRNHFNFDDAAERAKSIDWFTARGKEIFDVFSPYAVKLANKR